MTSNVHQLFDSSDCMTPTMLAERFAQKAQSATQAVVFWMSEDSRDLSFCCSGFSVTELNLLLDHVKMLILRGEFNP